MITLDVRVIPRVRKTACARFRDDVLVIAIEGVTHEQIRALAVSDTVTS